jgi:hypothetical protein
MLDAGSWSLAQPFLRTLQEAILERMLSFPNMYTGIVIGDFLRILNCLAYWHIVNLGTKVLNFDYLNSSS